MADSAQAEQWSVIRSFYHVSQIAILALRNRYSHSELAGNESCRGAARAAGRHALRSIARVAGSGGHLSLLRRTSRPGIQRLSRPLLLLLCLGAEADVPNVNQLPY